LVVKKQGFLKKTRGVVGALTLSSYVRKEGRGRGLRNEIGRSERGPVKKTSPSRELRPAVGVSVEKREIVTPLPLRKL